jgi:NADH-quinone oxidoreductase subunit M
VRAREWAPIAVLLVLAVAIGLAPRPLLDLLEPAAAAAAALVSR